MRKSSSIPPLRAGTFFVALVGFPTLFVLALLAGPLLLVLTGPLLLTLAALLALTALSLLLALL